MGKVNILDDDRKKNAELFEEAFYEKKNSEKIGLRGPMPPGILFAVYNSETGAPEYIPPEYIDIPEFVPIG